MAAESEFVIEKDDASMLGELLGASISPAAADWLLTVQFPREWHDDAEELARKNSEGEITEAELRRLDTYVHVGDLLSILKLQARQKVETGNGKE